MKRLIIHVGAHKTATTFTQSILSKNAAILRELDIGYQTIGNDAARALRLLTKPLSNADYEFALNLVISRVSSEKTAVLSWEGFLGAPVSGRSFYGGVAPFFRLLKDAAERTDRDLVTIIYVRRQDDFLRSYYLQTVKEGATHSPRNFLKRIDLKSFNWMTIINQLRSISSCAVVPFEIIDQSSSAFFAPFCSLLGITTEQIDLSAPKTNIAYGQHALSIALFVQNLTPLGLHNRRKLRKLLEALPPTPKAQVFMHGQLGDALPAWRYANMGLVAELEIDDKTREFYLFSDLGGDF